jgi:hypothetical protein
MANLTRSEMRTEVETIVDRTNLSTNVNTRLQWSLDEIAGRHPWECLHTENTSLVLQPSIKAYTIPTTIRAIENVRYINDVSEVGGYLEYKNLDDFVDLFPYPEGQAESAPTCWTRKGSTILVNPIPGTDECSLVTGTDSNVYACKVSHTAAAGNCPITGASYATYWALSTSSDTADTWATATEYFCHKLYLIGTLWPTALSGDSNTSDLDRTLDRAIIYLAAAMVFEMIEEEEKASIWQDKADIAVERAWAMELGFNVT